MHKDGQMANQVKLKFKLDAVEVKIHTASLSSTIIKLYDVTAGTTLIGVCSFTYVEDGSGFITLDVQFPIYLIYDRAYHLTLSGIRGETQLPLDQETVQIKESI